MKEVIFCSVTKFTHLTEVISITCFTCSTCILKTSVLSWHDIYWSITSIFLCIHQFSHCWDQISKIHNWRSFIFFIVLVDFSPWLTESKAERSLQKGVAEQRWLIHGSQQVEHKNNAEEESARNQICSKSFLCDPLRHTQKWLSSIPYVASKPSGWKLSLI